MIKFIFFFTICFAANPLDQWIDQHAEILKQDIKSVSFQLTVNSEFNAGQNESTMSGKITVGNNKQFRFDMGSRTVVSDGKVWKSYDERTDQIFIQEPDKQLEKSLFSWVKLKKMSEKLVKDILKVYGYTSARVVIREDIDSDQLVDFITGNKTYAKSITALNKIDLVDKKFLKKVSKKLKTEFIPVSADANDNIAELRDRIYDELQFIRIYLRPKGGETDYKEPLIIRNGNSVLDVCNKLHRKLRKDFRYGLVWGKSVKFGGQRVGLKHILIDEDVLTIIKTKGT